MLVDVAEQQVSEHEAEVALEGLKEPSNGGLRPSTVRAFEVAILDQGHRRVGRPANVVDVGVDGCGEVLERSGDAIFPSAEYPPWEMLDHAEHDPGMEDRADEKLTELREYVSLRRLKGTQ